MLTLLLRSLRSVFHVTNHIRLGALGSLYLSDTARRSVLLVRCSTVAAVADCLWRVNAEGAERIRAMMLSDDVSGDDSFDDGTECDGGNVTGRVEKTLGRMITAALKWTLLRAVFATDSCFYWAGQDAVRYGENFYTHSTQMAKYSDKIARGC